ncbi:MAG: peptide chain release factor N(5)-glutamine methyltransferase [Saprospiraceae bacterium]
MQPSENITLPSIREAREAFRDALLPVYEIGEANQLTRIIFEDAFKLFDAQSSEPFVFGQYTDEFLTKLLAHVPVQYLMGKADFYGRKFIVDYRVLIPRQETEELVFEILQRVKSGQISPNARGLEIGTGSGCIASTLQLESPTLDIWACDISREALDVAEYSAAKLNAQVHFLQMDALDSNAWNPLPQFDFIVSNPPYIPYDERAQMDPGVIQNEPALALFVADDDPFIFYKTILDQGRKHLLAGGFIFFEINALRRQQMTLMMADFDDYEYEFKKDINGMDRMLICTRRKRAQMI